MTTIFKSVSISREFKLNLLSEFLFKFNFEIIYPTALSFIVSVGYNLESKL